MPQTIMKYTQRQLDGMRYPQLLVLKDKYETDYYLLKCQSDLFRACLEVLRVRLDPKTGYIIKPDREPYGLRVEANMSEDQIDELPHHLRNAEMTARKHNQQLRAEHAEETQAYYEAVKALKEGDGPKAYEILRTRRDHEYEGFELVVPRVP